MNKTNQQRVAVSTESDEREDQRGAQAGGESQCRRLTFVRADDEPSRARVRLRAVRASARRQLHCEEAQLVSVADRRLAVPQRPVSLREEVQRQRLPSEFHPDDAAQAVLERAAGVQQRLASDAQGQQRGRLRMRAGRCRGGRAGGARRCRGCGRRRGWRRGFTRFGRASGCCCGLSRRLRRLHLGLHLGQSGRKESSRAGPSSSGSGCACGSGRIRERSSGGGVRMCGDGSACLLLLLLLRLRLCARVEHECPPFRFGRLLIGAGPCERQRHDGEDSGE